MSESGADAAMDIGQVREKQSPIRRAIGPVIGILAVIFGAWLLYRTLAVYEWQQIVGAIAAIPVTSLAGGAAFAALSYFCLSWFDWLALRYVGKPQPYRRAALASFTSLSIGHNIGFAGLSSGAIRYRFYQRWGLSLADVAKLVLFCGVTVATGLASVAGLTLVLSPDLASRFTGISEAKIVGIGSAFLAVVAIYLGISGLGPYRLTLRSWSLEMPTLKLACAQVAVGSLNFLCVAASLHQIIYATNDISYFDVAGAYVVSNIAGILSHVPGGVGVIETVLTILLPGVQLIGALVMFRVIYFLVPLSIGLPLLGLSEILLREERAQPGADL